MHPKKASLPKELRLMGKLTMPAIFVQFLNTYPPIVVILSPNSTPVKPTHSLNALSSIDVKLVSCQ